jgi:hypothetical protein
MSIYLLRRGAQGRERRLPCPASNRMKDKQYTVAQQEAQKKAAKSLLDYLLFLASNKIKPVKFVSRMGRHRIRLNALVFKSKRGAMILSLNSLIVGLLLLGGCTPY